MEISLKETLKRIWKDIPIWKQIYQDEECNTCSYSTRCGGGCRENALVTSGAMDSDDNLKKGGFGSIHKRWDGFIKDYAAVKFYKNLKFRNEEFGATVLRNASNYTYLDHFGFEILKAVYSRGTLTKKDILELNNKPDFVNERYVNKMFSTFVNNGIAIPEVN